MTAVYSSEAEVARTYYNSADADNFYAHVWGGEDIHIGLYQRGDEAVAEASRASTALLAGMLGAVGREAHILDIGSGYGGASRTLARRFGCRVTALNLSERENERNRALSNKAGLAGLIDVVDGSFEAMPLADATFDVVWSMDALLHTPRREDVVGEAWRVLKPGGQLIFTDIMESGRCSREDLAPVLARIHLQSMGTPAGYLAAAERFGFERLAFVDLTPHLVRHYARIADELAAAVPRLEGLVSAPFVANALKGLAAWVAAGEAGCLTWGVQHYRKP